MSRRSKPRPHSIGGNKLPKGAHRLPTGGYEFSNLPKTKPAKDAPTQIRVHAVYREQVDVKRLAQVLIDFQKRQNQRDKSKD